MNTVERLEAARRLAPGGRESRRPSHPVWPQWNADGDRFVYLRREAARSRWQQVDVQSLSQRPLFDHAGVAAALSGVLGQTVDPEALPLSRVRLADDGALSFTAAGHDWSWRDSASELIRIAPAFADHEAISPDGTLALSLAGPNLRLRQLGGEALVVTEDGEEDFGYGDYHDDISGVSRRLRATPPNVLWSPDSQCAAVLRSDRRALPVHALHQSAPAGGGPAVTHHYRASTARDGQGVRHQLWLVRRDGARVATALPPFETYFSAPFALGNARWSRDGAFLDLLIGDAYGQHLALWRVRASDGRADCLHTETGEALVSAAPSIAERPVFEVLSDGRLLWWSERSGWGHLWMLDRKRRTATAITQGEWQVRSLLRVDEARGELLFTASGREPGLDPYAVQAYRVRFDGSDLTRLGDDALHHEFQPGVQDEGRASVSPDGRCWVDNASSPQAPMRAVLRDREGRALMTLVEPRAGEEFPAGMPLPEPFAVTALDGRTRLHGLLYRPLAFDPAQRYPVIEVIYGAPQTTAVPKAWASNHHGTVAEQLAALGFVVVILDGPGTPHRSRAFLRQVHGHLERCGGLPDHVAAIRHLAAERPWMDVARIGIVGGSGGGYATVRALASHPDFYRVGAALCGNHDNADYVVWWGGQYLGPYSASRYAAQANRNAVATIQGRLLLIHGEMDDNVRPSHSLVLAEALRAAGKTFEIEIVPNAGHMLVLLPEVRQRLYDYFLQHLGTPGAG